MNMSALFVWKAQVSYFEIFTAYSWCSNKDVFLLLLARVTSIFRVIKSHLKEPAFASICIKTVFLGSQSRARCWLLMQGRQGDKCEGEKNQTIVQYRSKTHKVSQPGTYFAWLSVKAGSVGGRKGGRGGRRKRNEVFSPAYKWGSPGVFQNIG